MFKIPVNILTGNGGFNLSESVGALFWHAHPEHIGRFTGKIYDTNIAAFPNRNKTSPDQHDFNITSNKETGYKPLGKLYYDESSETFTGECMGKKIFVKKHSKGEKEKGKPSHVILEVVE